MSFFSSALVVFLESHIRKPCLVLLNMACNVTCTIRKLSYRTVSADNKSVASIPWIALHPIDTIEQCGSSSIACISWINAFNVSVSRFLFVPAKYTNNVLETYANKLFNQENIRQTEPIPIWLFTLLTFYDLSDSETLINNLTWKRSLITTTMVIESGWKYNTAQLTLCLFSCGIFDNDIHKIDCSRASDPSFKTQKYGLITMQVGT